MELAFAPQLERERERKRGPVKVAQPERPKSAATGAVVQRKPAGALPAYLGRAIEEGRLTVRPPGDEFEREADRVAAEVATRAPASGSASSRSARLAPVVRSPAFLPAEAGAPLDPELRARIESVVGADLAHVRVHEGAQAADLAAGLSARAFTHENHIYLGAREHARDPTLLAHEATHVVQQQGGGARGPEPGRGAIQRQFFWAHTQHPRQPAYPSPPPLTGPNCDPRAATAVSTESVELKGNRLFSPSHWLAEGIWCNYPQPTYVRANFGAIARGSLQIRAIPQTTLQAAGSTAAPALRYETASTEEYLELHHPGIPGAGADYPARLKIIILDSVVTGYISFWPGMLHVEQMATDWNTGFALEHVLGLNGLTHVNSNSIVNELRDGVLRYQLADLTFKLDDRSTLGGVTYNGPDDAIGGTGSFSVTDESHSFTGNATISAEGIADQATMPLRKVANRISGAANLSFSRTASADVLGGRLSGTISGSFHNGILTLTGTGSYRTSRLNGSVTVMLAPRFAAWTRVSQVLPVGYANAPTTTIGQSSQPGYVLVGWGTINFAINEWINGSVSAVYDPDGYITLHGVLRPTAQIHFLRDRDRWSAARQLGDRIEATVAAIPVGGPIADIAGYVWAELYAEGRIGPGRIYDLEVQARWSNRPGARLEGSATGRINLSAWGRLRAELGSGVSFRVGFGPLKGRVGSLELQGTATATVRAYVELQPTFEAFTDPSHPDQLSYRLTAELTAAGAADLGLTGRIAGKVGPVTLFTVGLGSYQWNLGSLGMRASVTHVLGDDSPIDMNFDSADFEESRFGSTVENLMNRRGARNDRGHDDEELGQTGAPPPAADTPTQLERPFTMSGVPHRIWVAHPTAATPDANPAAVVMMSSPGEGPLKDKLDAEAAEDDRQQHAQTGDAAAELGEVASEARRLAGRTRSVERSLNELQADARETGEVAGFQELADGVQTFGDSNQKTDLAEQAAPPPAPEVQIQDGRYVITSQADVEAIRAVAPQREQPPDGVDADDAMWVQYSTVYFPGKLRTAERQLAAGTTPVEGPQTWAAYTAGRAVTDELRAQKDFQPVLRQMLIDEHPGIGPERFEIDVGLRPTRRGVRRTTYQADVVIPDEANGTIEVFSAKVHNVRRQTVGQDDGTVAQWIRAAMREDVDEAAQKYGYDVEYRRERVSTPDGRRSTTGPRNPLYGRTLAVTRVNLVWQYSDDLIPERFIRVVRDAGEEYGVRERRRTRFPVRFQLRPEPPS